MLTFSFDTTHSFIFLNIRPSTRIMYLPTYHGRVTLQHGWAGLTVDHSFINHGLTEKRCGTALALCFTVAVRKSEIHTSTTIAIPVPVFQRPATHLWRLWYCGHLPSGEMFARLLPARYKNWLTTLCIKNFVSSITEFSKDWTVREYIYPMLSPCNLSSVRATLSATTIVHLVKLFNNSFVFKLKKE